MILGLFLTLLATNHVFGDFTDDFGKWLEEHYGRDVRVNLERKDLGVAGSFGGKGSRSEVLDKQPVVFVHGVSDRAHDKPLRAAEFFLKNGYTLAEVYGTTYANGAEGNPLQWAQYSMKCHYVKLVRALIVAVRMYTGRAVDVVSYSLGVPVTRKAILGGRCVDTGEDLGGPLTRIIDTFIGVDINRQVGYEATSQRFSIYSRADQLVGYQVCNRITTQVPGQTGEKIYADKNHDNTWYESYAVMKEMVLNHVVI